MSNIRGLIAFAAVRDGGEIGRICLDQQAIERHDASRLMHIDCLWIRHDAREAEIETERNSPSGLIGRAGEAVENAGQTEPHPVLFQKRERIVPGITGVNNYRLASIACDGHLLDEDRMLPG